MNIKLISIVRLAMCLCIFLTGHNSFSNECRTEIFDDAGSARPANQRIDEEPIIKAIEEIRKSQDASSQAISELLRSMPSLESLTNRQLDKIVEDLLMPNNTLSVKDVIIDQRLLINVGIAHQQFIDAPKPTVDGSGVATLNMLGLRLHSIYRSELKRLHERMDYYRALQPPLAKMTLRDRLETLLQADPRFVTLGTSEIAQLIEMMIFRRHEVDSGYDSQAMLNMHFNPR
jgi:hypothetical protein